MLRRSSRQLRGSGIPIEVLIALAVIVVIVASVMPLLH